MAPVSQCGLPGAFWLRAPMPAGRLPTMAKAPCVTSQPVHDFTITRRRAGVSWHDVRMMVGDALRSIKSKSAVQPLLWFTAIIALPCLYLAATAKKDDMELWTRVVLFAFAGVAVLSLMAGYGYWSIIDPDRLHSEEYRLRSRVLDITESKGSRI